MSQMINAVARVLAYARGRALLIRESSALALDPETTFGIVPIRMVAEQVVYAVAYGDPDGQPSIVLTWNPLDRDASFLEPFAVALNAYLTGCVRSGVLPRIWLPHRAALDVVEMLGHRYRTNRNVGPELQLMGAQCRLIADEVQYAGQQMVAIASELLTQHVATGQTPSEDQHLGALLVWLNPPAGVDVRAAAEQAALEPAAAMLARPVDDQVEALREGVRSGRRPTSARAEIERLVRDETLREWRLLVRGRQALWGLGLGQGGELGRLVRESFDRIAWQIDRSLASPSQPRSLASRLDNLVYAQSLAEYAVTTDDPIAQAYARRAGTVIEATVTGRVQPRPGFKPCALVLETRQSVLRVRRGTVIQLRGTTITGRVTDVNEGNDGRSTQLTVEIEKGVRHPQLPQPGTQGTWMAPLPVDLRWKRREVYRRMAERSDLRVYGDSLPESSPLTGDEDLAAVARRLRQ